MVDFKSIPTKEAWRHLVDTDPRENDYDFGTQDAHPMWDDVDLAYITQGRIIVNARDDGLGRTKWGRCRLQRRREFVNRERVNEFDTLGKILQAKWDEDDYMKTVETEKKKEQEQKAGDSEARSQTLSEESEENPGSQGTSA